MSPKLLIGRDLITKHNIMIDVPKARIMIGNVAIPLIKANSNKPAKREWGGVAGGHRAASAIRFDGR